MTGGVSLGCSHPWQDPRHYSLVDRGSIYDRYAVRPIHPTAVDVRSTAWESIPQRSKVVRESRKQFAQACVEAAIVEVLIKCFDHPVPVQTSFIIQMQTVGVCITILYAVLKSFFSQAV